MRIALLAHMVCSVLIQYSGYELEFNCENKTALRWRYNLTTDIGSAKRPSSYYIDPRFKRECQQKSTGAYGAGYDRGHLVTSNHMDFDAIYIKEAHYMTNIVPQISTFNQGIWQETELITECYRDFNPISIYGGLVYSDSSNDYFLLSHGIKTPDYFWKVLVTQDNKGNVKSIAWYIPNQVDLLGLDSYIVSITEIESKLNDGLGPILPESVGFKDKVGSMEDWNIPDSCDKS